MNPGKATKKRPGEFWVVESQLPYSGVALDGLPYVCEWHGLLRSDFADAIPTEFVAVRCEGCGKEYPIRVGVLPDDDRRERWIRIAAVNAGWSYASAVLICRWCNRNRKISKYERARRNGE